MMHGQKNIKMNSQSSVIVYCIRQFLSFYYFSRLRNIAKSDYQLRHVCPSVCLYGTTLLPLKEY